MGAWQYVSLSWTYAPGLGRTLGVIALPGAPGNSGWTFCSCAQLCGPGRQYELSTTPISVFFGIMKDRAGQRGTSLSAINHQLEQTLPPMMS